MSGNPSYGPSGGGGGTGNAAGGRPAGGALPSQPYGRGGYASGGYAGGSRGGAEGRGRGGMGGGGQRFGDASYSPSYRGGHRGGSMGGDRQSANSGPLVEDGPRTKLSSYVTPHDAVQDQPAQHGASIVRSGSTATEGGSILFFSSVQKKGGAFTASERETYAQLRMSRAIPRTNTPTVRSSTGATVVGSGIQTRNVARQFEELKKSREAQALVAVKRAVAGTKRSRFNLESDADEESDDEESEERSEGDLAGESSPVKQQRKEDSEPDSEVESSS